MRRLFNFGPARSGEDRPEPGEILAAIEERRAAIEERRAAIEERRAAIEERRAAIEDRRAALEELKALSGDPDALEPEDLDASEDHFITVSEDGFAVINTPRAEFETAVEFSQDTDTFAELAEAREQALAELMALSGDPEALEPSDLDASDLYSITVSESGNAVVSGPRWERETRLEYSDEMTIADLADLRPDLFDRVMPLEEMVF